jgi:hypothetical protein
LAIYSDVITSFLSKKIVLIARGGCPPDRWDHGLQVMLKKVAGVALVKKLCAVLLMEGDFNYKNKWIFGHEAINKLYHLGCVPGDQYSQKESSRGCLDGQQADHGYLTSTQATPSYNGSRCRQML